MPVLPNGNTNLRHILIQTSYQQPLAGIWRVGKLVRSIVASSSVVVTLEYNGLSIRFQNRAGKSTAILQDELIGNRLSSECKEDDQQEYRSKCIVSESSHGSTLYRRNESQLLAKLTGELLGGKFVYLAGFTFRGNIGRKGRMR